MEPVRFTKAELVLLNLLINWNNPCESGCVLMQEPDVHCYERGQDGTYKCTYKQLKESINEKLFQKE